MNTKDFMTTQEKTAYRSPQIKVREMQAESLMETISMDVNKNDDDETIEDSSEIEAKEFHNFSVWDE